MELADPVTWDFEYLSRVDKLDALYSKGKKLQWNGDTDLDWSIPVDPSVDILGPLSLASVLRLPMMEKLSRTQRETLNVQLTCYALSNILHGEQLGLMGCSKFVVAAPDYQAKLYGASQAVDEARHVEVFRRYLQKCGWINPPLPQPRKYFDEVLGEKWVNILIMIQMLVEGFTLATFHNWRNGTQEPLFKKLLEYIIRDEARHVAFGHIYVRRAIEEMHPDEREEVAESAFLRTIEVRSWYGPKALVDLEPAFSAAGVSVDDVAAELARTRKSGTPSAPETIGAPIDPIADLIFPALDRVGAMTPRTRAMFAKERSVFAGRVADSPHVSIDQLEIE